MAKFKLQPDPTFIAPVEIPVPGGKPIAVAFTFKYRNRDEMKEFLERVRDPELQISDSELILDMCSGWELSDPFTGESVDTLVLNYITATGAIFDKYIDEHTKARTKN